MKYLKKFSVLTLCFALSFNLVACKSKDIKKSDVSNSVESCDNIDFSNVDYNSYTFEDVTFNYPSFLGISKEGDDYISLATQDNSVSLKVYKEKPGTNFRNLYNYDMSSLKNINYDSYKDIRFSVSGTNNNFEYYKSSILLGSDIFSFMMIYPVEYLDEFDSIVTNVYKAFVANLDNNIQNNNVSENNSNNDTISNNRLQVATIEAREPGEYAPYPTNLILLGDYVKGKDYDLQYCKILGKNIINDKTIDDPITYNKVYHECGSINYPDFMLPGLVPDNGKNVDFISRDEQFYVNMGYSFNQVIEDFTAESYLNYLSSLSETIYSKINGKKLYIAQRSSENPDKIYLSCYLVDELVIFNFSLSFTSSYYHSHKDRIDSIFEEMDKTFAPVDQSYFVS